MLGTKIYKIKEREIVTEEGVVAVESYNYNHTQEFCDEYSALAEYCNANGLTIEDKGDYYECVTIPPPPEPTEKELLEQEKAELESWLRSHDYIGTKIATGRATIEEYAEEIALMTVKADRINEIDIRLSELDV